MQTLYGDVPQAAETFNTMFAIMAHFRFLPEALNLTSMTPVPSPMHL